MSNLEELYDAISGGENINEITEQIFGIYEDPQSIFEILQILSAHENKNVKSQAAIQLQFPLKRHLKDIFEDPIFEEIKSSILKILSNEPSMYIRDNIIHSMSFIVKKEFPWSQLFEFSQQLFNKNTHIQIETALKVLYIWIPSLSIEEFESIADDIGEVILTSISSDSADIQFTAFDLFAQSVGFIKTPLQQPFSDIFESLFSLFHELMINVDENYKKVCTIIENVFRSNDGCIDQGQALSSLLEMAQDEQISPECYFFIFSPVSIILSKQDDLDLLKPFVDDILKTTILCVSKSFDEDECHSQDSHIYDITILMEKLIEEMNNEKLFDAAISLLSDETENEAYATIIIYERFLELAPSVAIKYSADIANKLLKYSNSECPHNLFEASLLAISLLIYDVESNLQEFYEPIIKACMEALDSDHRQLIINSLKTITNLLDSLDYNSDYLENLSTKISELSASEDEEILTEAIPALSALVNAADKDIIPYIESFLPNILQAAEISEQTNPIIKGEALKVLAQVISIAPEETSSIIEPSIQLFKECIENEDSVIVAELLDSFSYLVSAKFDGIENILPSIIDFAIAQLDCEHFQNAFADDGFDPEDEENKDIVTEIVGTIINSLAVFNNAVESAPEIFEPYSEDIAHKALNCTIFNDPRIFSTAISVTSSIIVTYRFDPNEYLAELINTDEIFESSDDSSVSSMFTFCKEIIEAELPIEEEFIRIIFSSALKAIDHTLPFFDYSNGPNQFAEDEDDDDVELNEDDDENNDETDEDANDNSKFSVVESVFQFLSVFVSKYPDFFDAKVLSKFIDTIKRAQKKKFILETIYSTDILGQLFEVQRSVFTGLIQKFSLKIIEECLPLCDGTYRPCSLNAYRRIALTDFSVLVSIFQNIISFVESILERENQGQPFYKETISAAVSLLFALLKVQGSEFPIDTYFPAMLASLPSKYNADFIYGSLVHLFLEERDALEQYINEIIRALAQTLSLRDKELKNYALSEEVSTNMLKMLITLLQSVPNAQEMVFQEFVPNPSNQETLQTRLQSVSMDE